MTRLHCCYQFSLRRSIHRSVILLSIFAVSFFQSKIHAQQKSHSFFEADHPYIQYTGRIDFTNPKLPRSIVKKVIKNGDKRITKYFFSKQYHNGCDYHPDVAEHRLIANELTNFIRKKMKW